MKRRAHFTAIITFLILIFSSCGKDEYINSVTRMPVYFTVDLVRDHNLENLYQHKIYTKDDLIYDGEEIRTPGVVVINIGDLLETGVDFAAYDIRCPYEDRTDILLNINGIEAECPSCNSIYNLTFGNPTNGPSKKTLQSYCIYKESSGKRLKIRNCN